MPHWPAYGGGVAPCAAAGQTAARAMARRNFFTTPALDTRRAARRRPVWLRLTAALLCRVERGVDLGDLLRLDLLVRRAAVAARLAAEVEVEVREALAAAVRADLLERRQQLLLGLRPRVRAHRRRVGRADLDRAVALEAGRRRDELADDDVLLQAEQTVDLALDRGVGQHLRRLLEGGRREEGLGRERCLRDPEDQRLGRRLVLLLLLHARVLTLEHDLVHELTRQQVGVAVVLDTHLLQHLPDDELDVLVVVVYTLRLVYLRHLADEIQLGRGVTLEAQQACGAERALVQRIAGLDTLAMRDEKPRAARHRERALVLLLATVREDGDLQLPLGLLQRDRAFDLGELRGALRVPRLEDLDDTREAVRDVRAGDTAGVERPHRQLRARLADRLRGDDADRVADLRHLAARQERAVAGLAHAGLRLAREHRAHRHDEVLGGVGELLDDLAHPRHGELLAPLGDHRLARPAGRKRLVHVLGEDAARDALVQPLRIEERQLDELLRLAVLLADDHVLRDVDETPRQVARVGGAERRVGEALTGTVRRDEVLEHRQALHEVRLDRALDDLALRIRHQSAHAGELTELRERSAGARVGHHEERVQLVEVLEHRLGDRVGRLRPNVHDRLVPLGLGDEPVLVRLLDLADALLVLREQRFLRRRDDDVVLRDRHAGLRGVAEAELLDRVEHRGDRVGAVLLDEARDEFVERLLRERAVDVVVVLRELALERADRLAQRAIDLRVEDDAAGGGENELALPQVLDRLLQGHLLRVERELDLLLGAEPRRPRVHRGGLELVEVQVGVREVVRPEHHVLRRSREGAARRRRADVVRRQHQDPRLGLRLGRQRHVHRHLVAVEVGVERMAEERMHLDRLALDEHRLERLDAEAVERRGAVQQHRVLLDDLLEDVPDLGLHLVDVPLGRLDVLDDLPLDEPAHDERLEELERHELRQPALVQLQVRPGHDDRAARVVDALAEQVLAEPALLALEHV